MGLRGSRTRHEPQGLLPFEVELTSSTDVVTARAGLPMVLETMRALHLHKAIQEHVCVRKRASGYDEVAHLEALVLLMAAGGDCLDDLSMLGADKGLLRLLDREKLPSPDAARQFLQAFHDEPLLEQARQALPPAETSLVAPESAPLLGLGRVLEHLVRRMQRLKPAQVATIEADGTIIESHKREALPHYEGGRGYEPVLAYWVEQDLVVADQFRDGNVPAGKRPLDVVERAFATVPAEIVKRRFRGDSAFYEQDVLKWLADPSHGIELFTLPGQILSHARRLFASPTSSSTP